MGEDQWTITAWQLTYRARGTPLPVMLILGGVIDLCKPYGPKTGFAAVGKVWNMLLLWTLWVLETPHPTPTQASLLVQSTNLPMTISRQMWSCNHFRQGGCIAVYCIASPYFKRQASKDGCTRFTSFEARCLTQFVYVGPYNTYLDTLTCLRSHKVGHQYGCSPLTLSPSKLIKTTFNVSLYQTCALYSPLATSSLAET